MTSFAPSSASHGSAAASLVQEPAEWFPTVKKCEYEGPSSKNPLAFKHYNPNEVILGKKMSEWCRFGVCYWHTFRGSGADPFGFGTLPRPWDDGSNTVENAKRRVRVAFEFFAKLGVEYYTFHDRDVAPEGKNLAETNAILDEVTDYMLEMQEKTGIKLLWGTANLFAHPRYMNGGGTAPNADCMAYACAQVKKAMEVTLKLGGENFVFWGGREGYQSVLNTDVRRELDHFAIFLQAAVNHKEKIGADFQLLIEPKPREPMKHQYDYDAQTCIGFLKTYNLDKHFKLNIEPNHTTLAGHDYEHDLLMSSLYGFLGSIDANTGDTLLGWDTDQFPMDVKKATLAMLVVLKQEGLAPGGLNFDCKVRRESTDIEDMFISHIGAMDTFARGLRAAAAIIQVRQSLGDQIPTGFGRCMFLGCWVSRAFWNCRFCPLTASYPKPAALSLLLCPLDPCGD
eukprot:INCI17283.2.p1 GENE.INCI17283.2~~INCI17283.2.p1  ORF type:complete len:454 (-),score=82.56 INCI17283.2:1112-2473(-)